MGEGDLLAILLAVQGKVTVLQDFTADKGRLEAAIARVTNTSEPDSSSRAAMLEQAAQMLGALSGKKSLVYFVGGSVGPSATQGGRQAGRSEFEISSDDAAYLQRAIQAAVTANVAFFAIDTRGMQMPEASPVYTGVPASSSPLAKELQAQASAVTAGLPSRHAEFQTAPAALGQTLAVPLDGLSGKVALSFKCAR